MFATFLLVIFHNSIIWSLMTKLNLCLTGNDMPLLMMFATISLTLTTISTSMMTSSSPNDPPNDPLVYPPPPLDKVWLSEPERHAHCHDLEECYQLAEDFEQVKWIDKLLMNHLIHFQIWLSSLIVAVKLQTIHIQFLFQREETVILNLMNMMSQSYQWMLRREYLPTCLLLIWMILLLPLIVLQLQIPTIQTNLILNIHTKARNYVNAIWLSMQNWQSYLYFWT